jgi:excinuclease ABC subunit B
MKFKLKSTFSPTGDQPKAIKKLLAGLKLGYKHQALLGVTGSGKTFTMANIIAKTQKPTLIICHNKTLAAQLASEFREFFPENEVHYFVSYYDYYQPEAYIARTDTYIEKETDINEEIDRLRHASTQAILSRKDVIIIASVSCIYNLGSPAKYNEHALGLKINTKERRDDVLLKLVEMQYTRNDYAFWRGTFRVKGDILDIFPVASSDFYWRVEFLGDKIETISQINSITGKRVDNEKTSEIDIYPAKHYAFDKNKITKIIKVIRRDLNKRLKILNDQNQLVEAQRLEQRTNYDLEMIESVGYCNGIENYSSYFDGRKKGEPPFSLMDYFPKDYLLIIDESHMTVPQIGAMYNGDRARKKTLMEFGFRLPSALDNRPLQFQEFESKMNQVIYTSATLGPYEYEKTDVVVNRDQTSWRVDTKDRSRKLKDPKSKITEQIIRPTGLLDPEIVIRPTKYQVDDLVKEIEDRIKKKQRVLVTTLTKRMSEELAEYLQEMKIRVHYLHSEIETLERINILNNLRSGKVDVVVGINLLREGLDLPEVTLVAILDADKEGFLRSETSLIQTMGRAARHNEGKVIMYADKITGSMKRAIDVVERRRKVQSDYNKKHNIKPTTIVKEIRGSVVPSKRTKKTGKPKVFKQLSAQEKKSLIKDLKAKMGLAAQNLEFEKAAEIRDEIEDLKKY